MVKWQYFLSMIMMVCTACFSTDARSADFYSFMPLDAQTQSLLDYQKEHPHHPRFLKEVPLELLRTQPPYTLCQMPEVETIQNISIPGSHGPIPARLYTPKTDAVSLPVLLYFHGGGWALGHLDAYDNLCQLLAAKAECLVMSVDYHLAPEHPFPIPLQDCYEAVIWAFENIENHKGDSGRLAVGGDSAGGNLAAAVSLMNKDCGGVPLIYQVLIYPVASHQFDTLSYELFKEDYFLTREDMKCLWEYYVQGQDHNNPYISPLRAKDLSNLPPALLIVADYDVLRDEALAFGLRLQEAGVPLTLKKYGTIHGFIGFDSLDIGKQAIQDIAETLKEALHAKKEMANAELSI